MAVYSKLTGNRSIEVESCYWYDRGLESQRLRLPTIVQQLQKVLNESMILVPLLPCMFEVAMNTEEAALMSHTLGAFRDVRTSALLSRSNARSVPERSDQRGMWSDHALLDD